MTQKEIISEYFRQLAKKKTEARARAARENGKKGGRPKKKQVTQPEIEQP